MDHKRKSAIHADRQVLLAGIGILAVVAVIVWSYTQSTNRGRTERSSIDAAVSRQGNASDDVEAIERDFIAFPFEDLDTEAGSLDAELKR